MSHCFCHRCRTDKVAEAIDIIFNIITAGLLDEFRETISDPVKTIMADDERKKILYAVDKILALKNDIPVLADINKFKQVMKSHAQEN